MPESTGSSLLNGKEIETKFVSRTERQAVVPPDAAAYFEDVPDLKLPAEMKALAAHIVDSKASHFDPSRFVDHYETALVEMLRAKQAGRVVAAPKEEPGPQRVINLMDALRASIGAETKKSAAASTKGRAGGAAKGKAGR